MRTRFNILAVLITFSLLSANASTDPDYALDDLNGKTHRVSELKGKWLVLNFWATW